MEKRELEGKLLLAEESNRLLRLAIQRGGTEVGIELDASDQPRSSPAGIGQSARANSRKRSSPELEDDFFERPDSTASIPTVAGDDLLRLSSYGVCLLSVWSASSADVYQFSRSNDSAAC